jgi:hypothetical protein
MVVFALKLRVKILAGGNLTKVGVEYNGEIREKWERTGDVIIYQKSRDTEQELTFRCLYQYGSSFFSKIQKLGLPYYSQN